VSRPRLVLWATLVLLPGIGTAQQVTRNPHGKLAEECAVCHSSQGWVPAHISASFDHAKKGFMLVGAHGQTACRSCHLSLDFQGTARDCASCHKDVHHGELGTDCSRCHTPRSFLDRSTMTRAHQLTRFPLTGTHITLDCESCHAPSSQGQMTFVNAPVLCVECHLPQYQSAKNPDHAGGQFPQDCAQCHLTTVWASARFNHDATGFPLTGMHRAVACQQCHGDGVYSAKSTACVSCHQQDYNGTTTPPHAPAGFPTSCETCHTTAGWTTATFNHDATRFPLTGAHRAVPCQQCHGDGVYAGKSTACVSCHQQDYNGTTNPAHASAGFPTTCETCHTTSAWTGASFNHTWFPVPHRTATQCTDCHLNASDFSAFVCTNCHTQSQTDPNHSGVRGYIWNSTNCYACHPNGRGG
jgi:hypothetical protein